jgi:hypothetical protein
MARIGAKKNFMIESQQNEIQNNEKLVICNSKSEGGITNIDLILEPNRFDALGSECRLSFDEFCDVINQCIDEEEKDWHELRMKDQVNMTRDAIIEATILKYAKEHYDLDRKNFNGSDLNYVKRYDGEGRYTGEAIMISLTLIPQMNMTVR